MTSYEAVYAVRTARRVCQVIRKWLRRQEFGPGLGTEGSKAARSRLDRNFGRMAWGAGHVGSILFHWLDQLTSSRRPSGTLKVIVTM